MSFSVEDVLGTYLLLNQPILRDEDEQESFISQIRENLNVEAIDRDASIAIPSLRIYLDIEGGRTVIKRDYPEHDNDLNALAEVIDIAFSIAGLQRGTQATFTWSTWLVYQQQESGHAGMYLGERMLKEISLAGLSMNVVGGAATYHINSSDEESTMWIAKFQPRFSDPELKRIYLDLDWHNMDVALPSGQDEILQCLKKTRATAHALAESVHSNA